MPPPLPFELLGIAIPLAAGLLLATWSTALTEAH